MSGVSTIARPLLPQPLVLAGGRSRRFGDHKALHVWRGRTFIDHVLSVLRLVLSPAKMWIGVRRVGNDTRLLQHFHGQSDTLFIEDDANLEGPVAGLVASLSWARHKGIPWVMVCSCDTPAIRIQLVSRMVELALTEVDDDVSAIIPRTPSRFGLRFEALQALYRPELALPVFEAQSARGTRRLQDILGALPGRMDLDPPQLECLDPLWRRSLANINSPDDLAALDGSEHPF